MESIKIKTGKDEELIIQTVELEGLGKAKPAGAKKKELSLDEISKKFKGALSFIKDSGISLSDALKNMETSEAELKLSIGFSAEGNIVLVKSGATANLEITLKWKKK